MSVLRRVAKSVVEGAATGSGLSALFGRLRPRNAAVLAYHNVVTAEEAGRGDQSLHLPFPAFVAQLDRLQRRYEFVSLQSALEEPAGSKPRVVVTFDDAYRGAINLALPELRKRGIPATVFVAPGLLGAADTWWDALGEAGVLTAATRERALREAAGIDGRARGLLTGSAPPLPGNYGIATEEELLEAAGPLVELGSHSWGHEHLPSLDPGDLRESLTRAREWLERQPGNVADLLALPYGAGSPTVARMASETGYRAVLEIAGGLWLRTGHMVIPRINVPAGLSPRGLELRTSGLLD